MDTLSLQFDRAQQQAVLTLCGRLDGSTAATFNEFCATHLTDSDVHVTLECTGLNFVSSAGLREFLMLAKRADRLGGKTTLAGASGTVAFTLEIAGFNALFKLAPSLPTATTATTPAPVAASSPPTAAAQPPAGLLKRWFSKEGKA